MNYKRFIVCVGGKITRASYISDIVDMLNRIGAVVVNEFILFDVDADPAWKFSVYTKSGVDPHIYARFISSFIPKCSVDLCQ